MGIFWKYLLFCVLIALFGGNAAGEFSPHKDVLTREANLSQDDKSIDYRLPKSIRPISYEIMLMPNLQNFKFEGIEKIIVVVEQETDTITLHVGNIQIRSQSVLMNETNMYKSKSYDEVTEKYTITLSETLKKGSEILISFNFYGNLRDDLIGFYKSSYFDEYGQIKWLAATQFQATHARHAFPCFDEPSFKAIFMIRILRDNNYTSLSNMPLAEINNPEGNVTWDNFNQTVPMSTYLVAFIVSEFHYLKQDQFKVWARPNVVSQAEYALKIGTIALKFLGDIFGQKYHLPKMDMVAVPDFAAGAMENWGLVTYRENQMLYVEGESSALAQQTVASVIVHELTHMWFGNLVTPEWWGYLWLSEAFANYFQYFATADIEVSWNMKEQFVVDEHQAALIADSLESSQPMTREISSQLEIGGMGDIITYSKGASIIRMMNLTFGNDVFISALRDYLNKNKEAGLGYPDALWTVLQTQVNRKNSSKFTSVKTTMETWTTKAGYPVISVSINDKGVYVTQERLLLRNLDNTTTDVTWWVPLTWTTQSKPNFDDTTTKYWLNIKEDVLDLQINPQEWIIFNIQSSGFYRVNYNYNGWRRIFDVLHSDKFNDIHILNRAALVDDLLNLGRAGYQDYATVLDGITYLKRETNYLAFRAALNGLSYLNKRFSGYKDHSLFKKYILSLINDRRKELGYKDRKGDDRLTVLLRRDLNIWACNLDDEECVTTYIDKFQKWKANPSIRIKPNERTTAYCVGIRNGTSEDWEFLWKQYFYSNYAAEQIEIINALGCSLNTTILERYLKYAINDYQINRIRKQNSMNVFTAVYSSMTGAEYILDFVDKHYKDMKEYYGGLSKVAMILDGVSQRLSTPKLVDKFQNLVDKHKTEFASILDSLEASLKVAKYELKWYKTASEPIIQWIKEYNEAGMITEPTVSVSTPLPEEDMTKYRLPTKIIPDKYTIAFTPKFKDFTFDGNVEISVSVVEQTDLIVLHSAGLELHSVVVKGLDDVKVKSYKPVEKYEFLEIELDRTVNVGTNLIIEIAYKGVLVSDLRGFYKSSYVNNNGSLSWLAATQLEPVHARRMFPCFDEPALKATFIIQVCTETGIYDAISNMKVSETKNSADCPSGITVFSESMRMSTYLVAVVVSDFKSTKKVENKFAVYTRPNALDQAEYALSVMSPLVKFFENNLANKYQIDKLDMVALPDFEMGAMENWGLLTYREANLLYDQDHSSITSKQAIRNVIAHEIAHQWFGNLVSPAWWKYVWLSEGFGRYFQYHAPAIVFNDTTSESQFVVDQVHSAFVADSSNSTHPMSHEVYTPDEIQNIFDTIAYAKAASVLRMVEKSFGQQVFYDALKSYLDKRKYDVSTPQDLYEEFQNQINLKGQEENIQEILDTWTTQAGYPVVHADIKDKIITLKQERFLFKRNEVDDKIWHIPITIATTAAHYKNTIPTTWLREKEAKITSSFDSEMLIINVQQSGFYRVNYDKEHWLLLIRALMKPSNFDSIHEINRAALIDDLMNLARANYVNYGTAISATEYLTKEWNYLPWRAFYNNLPYLNRRFRGRDMEVLFKKYLVSLIQPLYERLTFEDDVNDKDDLIRTRNMLRIYTREWACKLDISDCTFTAEKYFLQKRHYLKKIPPNYRGVVYCVAMKTSEPEFTYNFLLMEYEKSNVMANKLVILSSLACSPSKSILEKLLLTAIEEDSFIRLQDSTKVFSNVYDASLLGVEVVMNVIMNDTNYDNMSKRFGGYAEIKNIVSALASRLSTHELYGKYQELLEWLVNKEPAFKDVVDSYLANAQYEFDWYEKKVPEIFEALDKLLPDDTYRLPSTLYPELYDISLAPYMQEGRFDGKVQIHIRVEKHTSVIVLNSHNLRIGPVKVYRIGSKNHDDSRDEDILLSNTYTLNTTTQQLKIYLNEFVNAEKIKVDIEFNGILNDNMQGFYRSSYIDKSGTLHWLATTQFQPVHAREAFPCFDEPAFKSRFSIKIQRPVDYVTSLSNMPYLESLPSEIANYTWDVFQNSIIEMPTYLVAFVVSKFKSLEKPVNKINVWGRPEVVKNGYFAQNAAVTHLRTLEDFTGIEYPLPKVDLVGIPDFDSGAMENWGLITFREYALFHEENITTSKYEKYITRVVAHELAHTWFGNLVTCQWWDYIWLNEGFAEYLEWYASDQMLPKSQFMNQFVVYELQEALAKDASDSAHPMTNPVKTPKEIKGIFDYVTYGKSACVLRMFFNAFDEEVHKLALRDYLTQHKGGTARPEDLWKSFEPYASILVGVKKLPIQEAMDTWTNQPGYPVVHAFLDDSVLTLTQERFVLNNKTRGSRQSAQFYWIPIHIETSLIKPSTTYASFMSSNDIISLKTDVWLGQELTKIYINPLNEWFIVNPKQTGFYRVNYDNYSWLRLIEELQGIRYDTIHVLNRAQIMDDLYYLARADYVDDKLWWKASKYLIQETEHLPWKTFINSMSYVYERFEGQSHEENLKKYILILMSRTYDRVGFNSQLNDKLMDRMHREMILQWACKLDKKECVEKSINLFSSWKNGTTKSIPIDAQTAVYCTALRNGTSDDWDFLWNKYLKTNLDSEKLVIINALGCSRIENVLYNYLMKIINDAEDGIVIRKQDASAVFASVYSTSQLGINVTLDFLLNNLGQIYDYFGNWDDVRDLAANAASHISDLRVYNKLSYLYAIHEEVFPSQLVQPVHDNVANNYDWYEAHGEPFGEWISNELRYTYGGGAAIEPLNVILITLAALISYFLSCH